MNHNDHIIQKRPAQKSATNRWEEVWRCSGPSTSCRAHYNYNGRRTLHRSQYLRLPPLQCYRRPTRTAASPIHSAMPRPSQGEHRRQQVNTAASRVNTAASREAIFLQRPVSRPEVCHDRLQSAGQRRFLEAGPAGIRISPLHRWWDFGPRRGSALHSTA